MKVGSLVRVYKDLYSYKYNAWISEGTVGIVLGIEDEWDLYPKGLDPTTDVYYKVYYNNKSDLINAFYLEMLKTAEGTK